MLRALLLGAAVGLTISLVASVRYFHDGRPRPVAPLALIPVAFATWCLLGTASRRKPFQRSSSLSRLSLTHFWEPVSGSRKTAFARVVRGASVTSGADAQR